MSPSRFIALFMIGAALISFESCQTTQLGIDKGKIPGFYTNPPASKDSIFGVGQAKMSTLDLSRTTAIARARDDVARQVRVSVKNALTDYAQQAGQGNNDQAIQFTETVSRQIVDVTLADCRTDKIEVIDDGTVYALVRYPVESLLASARERFTRNEASAFAEFKANEAVERLNRELSKASAGR